MWDRYGGGYKGFALEYDLRNCIFKYNKLNLNVNLFPIMYTDQRPDVTLDEGNIHMNFLSKPEIKYGLNIFAHTFI